MSLSESIHRARAVRAEAEMLASAWADDRQASGDPEGADCFRDLARAIRKIPVGPRK